MLLRRYGHLLFLLAILLLASGVRLWRLDSLPPGFYHDEAYDGLDGLSLVQGKTFPQFYEGWELYAQDAHADRPPEPTRFPVFFEGNYGREPLYLYLVALSIWLFGPTPWAVRLVSAVAGVLAVFTTYLAARALWLSAERQPETAMNPHLVPLLAAFSLAILYPAVHFSRFGIRPMLFLPFEALAVYCFWRGINRADRQQKGTSNDERTTDANSHRRASHSAPWFAATGFFLGAGLYTYANARLLPLLFILFILLWFWQEQGAWRRHWANVGLMAAVSLATAAPLLLFFTSYPYFFLFRLAYVANKGAGVVEDKPWLTWLNNVGRVLRGLLWQGETHLRHNLPGRPFLDPIQALLFLLGIIRPVVMGDKLQAAGNKLQVASSRWQAMSPRSQWLPGIFLWLWLLVMLLPSILSGDAPHFGRLTGAAPPIAILIAFGAAWLAKGNLLSAIHYRLSVRPSPLTLHALLAVAFLISAGLTLRDYFGRYAHHPNLPHDFYLSDWQMGQYAAAHSSDTTLYLTPTQEEMATIYFALADPERLRSYTGGEGAIPLGQPDAPRLYLVRPNHETSLARLQAYFPTGVLGEQQDNFIPFYVPATAPHLQAQPADVSPGQVWGGRIALHSWSAVQQKDWLTVTLAWQAVAKIDQDYTVFVHLLDTSGNIAGQLDRPPAGYPTSDWRPGELVLDEFTFDLPAQPGPFRLETGFYYLPTLERLGEAVVLVNNWQPD